MFLRLMQACLALLIRHMTSDSVAPPMPITLPRLVVFEQTFDSLLNKNWILPYGFVNVLRFQITVRIAINKAYFTKALNR